MKREYRPVLVETNIKKEPWTIDITNLSITQLIRLRESILCNETYSRAIQALDAIIKRDIETTIRSHNINKGSYIREYKKNKKEYQIKKKIKNLRRKKYD